MAPLVRGGHGTPDLGDPPVGDAEHLQQCGRLPVVFESVHGRAKSDHVTVREGMVDHRPRIGVLIGERLPRHFERVPPGGQRVAVEVGGEDRVDGVDVPVVEGLMHQVSEFCWIVD